jgi:hypothetical protein
MSSQVRLVVASDAASVAVIRAVVDAFSGSIGAAEGVADSFADAVCAVVGFLSREVYPDRTERELARRLSEQAVEFARLVDQLERQLGYMHTTAGQIAWLRAFPHDDPHPPVQIASRLPSGRLAPAGALLAALCDLQLPEGHEAHQAAGHRRRRRQRRGSMPAMIALSDCGLSTRMVAVEMAGSKMAPWSWLRTAALPPRPGSRRRSHG